MECKFTVGQKVVCINDKGWMNALTSKILSEAQHTLPQLGSIYQIEGIHVCEAKPGVDYLPVYLSLKGISFRPWFGSFRALRERPTETDISALRKLQDPKNHDKGLPRTDHLDRPRSPAKVRATSSGVD